MIYKGMLMPEQVANYYSDLKDESTATTRLNQSLWNCFASNRSHNTSVGLIQFAHGGEKVWAVSKAAEGAMNVAADRVRVIKLPNAPDSTDPLQKKRDDAFKTYFTSLVISEPLRRLVRRFWKKHGTRFTALVSD
jgi:hypothetical protein